MCKSGIKHKNELVVVAGNHASKFYPGIQFSIVSNCVYQHPTDENDPENVAMSSPSGLLGVGHSESGVSYYTDVLKTMLESGTTPLETLDHRDLPQGLVDAPGRMEHLQVAQVPRGDQGFPSGLVQRTKSAAGTPVPRGVDAVAVKEFVLTPTSASGLIQR